MSDTEVPEETTGSEEVAPQSMSIPEPLPAEEQPQQQQPNPIMLLVQAITHNPNAVAGIVEGLVRGMSHKDNMTERFLMLQQEVMLRNMAANSLRQAKDVGMSRDEVLKILKPSDPNDTD